MSEPPCHFGVPEDRAERRELIPLRTRLGQQYAENATPGDSGLDFGRAANIEQDQEVGDSDVTPTATEAA